ncbi:hypothetical protein FRC07_010595, partial [Ceratobasidium sp. 392]
MPSRRVAKSKTHQIPISTPANLLPPEILTQIFSEAICCCSRQNKYDLAGPIVSPLTLAAVCKRWRKLAIGYQSLWTHIDLTFNVLDKNGRYHRPEIWLERSQSAPLNVRVLQFYKHTEAFIREEGKARDSRLGGSNRPLAPIVSSIALSIRWPYESVLTRLLDLWTESSNCNKSLKVQSDSSHRSLTLHGSTQYKKSFELLEVLHLRNTVLSWKEFAFNNLIELEIHIIGQRCWCMTQPELAAALASCPRLQRLTLDRLTIEPSTAQKPIQATLEHLRVLQIGGCGHTVIVENPLMIEAVLGVINPGRGELSVNISLRYLKSPQRAMDFLIAFIHRSNVTTLRVHGYDEEGGNERPCFASQLSPLPNVQTLILEHWYFRDV